MEKYQAQILDSLKKLISFNSAAAEPSPGAPYGPQIDAALKYTLSLCQSLGLRTFDMNGICGYAETGRGEETFAVLCHLDVVPFNSADWRHDPLGGEIYEGRLYGRGALDDKGPTIAALYAVKRLLDEGFEFSRRIRFIFGLDEETGAWKSVEHYIKEQGMPDIGIAPDSDFPVINSEKGKANYILSVPTPSDSPVLKFKAGARSNIVPDSASVVLCSTLVDSIKKSVFFDALNIEEIPGRPDLMLVAAAGRAAHGAHPEKGENAALKLLSLLKELKIPVWDSLCDILSAYDGSGLGIADSDGISGALTMNAGLFEYDNTVAQSLKIELDIRHPLNVTKERLLEKLKSNTLFDAELHSFHRPLYVAPDDPLVVKLLTAYQSVTGDESAPLSIGGATFARALDYGVAFGPVFPNTVSSVHEADESVSIKELMTTAEIYYRAFLALC